MDQVENRCEAERAPSASSGFSRTSTGSHTAVTFMIMEGDPLIAMSVADILGERGMGIAGPFDGNSDALEYLETCRPDAAIMGLNVSDGVSDRTAERLSQLGIPFLTISGSPKEGVEASMLQAIA